MEETVPQSATYVAVGFRVGVGIRIRADFVALKENVSIGGLKELGTAARDHLIVGTLSVQTLGVRGVGVAPFIFPPCEINPENVQVALRSVEGIKQRLEAPSSGVSLEPQMIAINPDKVSVQEALFGILRPKSKGPE
jgi:hypothetical protein